MIRKGDIGTAIELLLMEDGLPLPIGEATKLEIIARKPGDIKVIFPATLSTDGSDGKIRFVTLSENDLNVSGTWKLQAQVVLPTGSWRSSVVDMQVGENL